MDEHKITPFMNLEDENLQFLYDECEKAYDDVFSSLSEVQHLVSGEQHDIYAFLQRLRDEVKTAIVDSYDYQTRNSNLTHEQHVSVLKNSIDVFCFSTPIRLTLNEYIHSSSQGTYSGSLDAKEIKKQFNRFGVNLEDLRCDQLVKIRDNRNKLGHGEVSFLECSNDSTIQYLKKAKIKMFEFFDEVIIRVEEYVNNKRFLAANVLP